VSSYAASAELGPPSGPTTVADVEQDDVGVLGRLHDVPRHSLLASTNDHAVHLAPTVFLVSDSIVRPRSTADAFPRRTTTSSDQTAAHDATGSDERLGRLVERRESRPSDRCASDRAIEEEEGAIAVSGHRRRDRGLTKTIVFCSSRKRSNVAKQLSWNGLVSDR
jgi:hypothetical protein